MAQHARVVKNVDVRTKTLKGTWKDALGVVVHDDSHGVQVEAVRLGHHALAEAVRDVVRAQEAGEHDEDVRGDDGEHDGVPPLQHDLLELEVRALASRQHAPCITSLADGRLDEGIEVSTASELVLNPQTAGDTESVRPLSVDFALKVERTPLVGDVARCNEQRKADPKEE